MSKLVSMRIRRQSSAKARKGGKPRLKRGGKPKRNADVVAIADFMSSEDGLRTYFKSDEAVLLLLEDKDVRVFNWPSNLHLLSTAGLLRGMERSGFIASADDIIIKMTKP